MDRTGEPAAGSPASPAGYPTPPPPPPTWRERPGCLPLGLGVVLVVLGIPMLVCPGPGIGSILLGASLIATGLGLRRRRSS